MLPTPRELQPVLEQALHAGAAAASVHIVHREARRGQLEPAQRPRLTQQTNHTAVVKVWLKDGQQAEASGPRDSLPALFKRAISAAEGAPSRPFAGPWERPSLPARGLGIHDVRHAQITDDDRIEVLTSSEAAARKIDPTLQLRHVRWTDTREHRVFANTRGLGCSERGTTYQLDVAVFQPAHKLLLTDRFEGRSFADVSCLPFAADVARRLRQLSGPEAAGEGAMPVLIPPRPMSRLIDWIADQVAGGPPDGLLRTRRAEPLFHRRIHIIDDGLASGGLRTRGFDDDGVSPMPITVVREGHVQQPYLDVITARESGADPTGHLFEGALRPSNLQLHSGNRSIHASLSDVGGTIFEVDDLPDLSGINPKTGQLRLPVRGRIFQGQEAQGPVREAWLTGNLADALSRVITVASDTDRLLHVDAPGIFVEGLTVER